MIRFDGLSRDEGKQLVNKYDGKVSDDIIKKFCFYLEITVEEFWSVVDQYVNKDLFIKDKFNKWIPKFTA